MSATQPALLAVLGVACLALAGACLPPPPVPPSDAGPDAAVDAGVDAPPDARLDAPADAAPQAWLTAGPGLKLAISGVSIDRLGGITALFTVTDGDGVPLDIAGAHTTGAVEAKWVVSVLAPASSQEDGGAPPVYSAYTTQLHTSVDGGMEARLPDSDTGGTIKEVGVAQGTYAYTFGTLLPATFDATRTHTIGVWGTRVFGGLTYVVNTLYDFVPAGPADAATASRAIVTTQACNQCHNPLGYHERDTQRREVGLCVLCHATPMADVTNGDALDMPVMIHKIHQGRSLPSVLAGATYELTDDVPVTDGGATTIPAFVEHSAGWFPGEVQNCAMCHQGPQGGAFATAPSRSACGSCHDLTSFVYPPPPGTTLHPGGQQTTDTTCLNSGCHGPTDQYGIAAVHMTPSTNPAAPVLVLTITNVTNTQPRETPVVHFSVTEDGAPLDILATPLPWLAATLAGPTTDYAEAEPTQYTVEEGSPDLGLALDGATGSYAFTFPTPLPSTASGSYAIGMEGYLQAGPGAPVYAAENPVAYIAITDPSPVPRRTVVERTSCNSCHYDLLAHGGTIKSPEYCVLCHTANKVGNQDAPRLEVPTTNVPSESFDVLVHKIHRGSQLAQGYVVGGLPGPTMENPEGTPVDFGKVLYPGDLRACWACHAATSYLPPLPGGLLPTVTEETIACNDPTLDPTNYCSSVSVASQPTLPPMTTACTACHDSPSDIAHAEANISSGSESCLTGSCHGAGETWDVQTAHVLPP